MVNFFNELGKVAELTVVFEKKTSSERNNRWKENRFNYFKGIILKGFSTAPDASISPQIIKYINKKYDYIIVSNPLTPTGIIAIEYMKIRKIQFIIESEGSFAKNGKGIKERFKKHIIKNAFLYFSTTEKADEYLLQYGAIRDRIVKYHFTSLYKKDILNRKLSQEEKLKERNILGLKGNKIAIAVGRFIPLKSFDLLIRIWENIDKNNYLYIIGEGQEKNFYQKIIEKLNISNVIICDFLSKKKLFQYYKSADLFIHPTSSDVWGLVINEAMACALPIITTNMCMAGLELVKDDENGFIVPVGNKKKLHEKINYIFQNDDIRENMSKRSLEKIELYTFESMAKTHITILQIKSNNKLNIGDKY